MINWTIEETVAVISINNPPLNASNHAVRAGIVKALIEIEAREDIKGVVLTGVGAHFVAGSDIKEFGVPLAEPQMPDVIAAIENCPLPVVAAIRGACLGGGYELSLGCDYRLASVDGVFGLPEVSLGIVPGAGGTQKLPRLTGIPKALELIIGAKRVNAYEAVKLGMIDGVVEGDLTKAAFEYAQAGHPKRRVIDLSKPVLDIDEANPIRDKALKRAKNRPAAKHAADLIYQSAKVEIAEGLAQERAIFQDIRISPEAFALRHVFFAERGAAKFMSDEKPINIQKISVIGGGTMGAGIAYAMLKSGCMIDLIERDIEASNAAKNRVFDLLENEEKRGFVSTQVAADIKKRFCVHDTVEAVFGSDMVIEAVFEDMDVKKSLIDSIMAHVSNDTIIATNTSYLDVDEMAKAVLNPSRFIGLHFFSPAHRMSLLEIVRGKETSNQTIVSAFRLARKLGKQPVLAGNAYGFIGNRIYAAYRRHAEYLLQEGAPLMAIDSAMVEFGMAMGPFEVADMSGLDIAWRMRQSIGKKEDQRYVDIADRLCEEGHFGRKTGAGYYKYEDGKKRQDIHLDKVISDSQNDANIISKMISSKNITERLLGAIVIEAIEVLSKGIAHKAGDIDVALIHGYGFPRWTGGPLYWASQLPKENLIDILKSVQSAEQKSLPLNTVIKLIGELS